MREPVRLHVKPCVLSGLRAGMWQLSEILASVSGCCFARGACSDPKAQVTADPESINVLPEYGSDPRTPDKLVDGMEAGEQI